MVEADSGEAALHLLAQSPLPDLAVVDVQMPDIDGWDVLAAVRRDPATAALPVILCTVKSGHVDLSRAWELGADGYVTKPFAIDELAAEAHAVVSRTPDERAVLRAQRLSENGPAAPPSR